MNEQPFEVGDIVKCVSLGNSTRLVLDNTYTVKTCFQIKDKWYLTVKELEEIEHHHFSSDRFIKVVNMHDKNDYMRVLRENKRLLEI